MNAIVQILNTAGRVFVDFAVPMLIQSGVLILILLAVDAVLRKRVRAVFRYWIWMLVLVKLVLPPSLWSPVSVGTWFGDRLEVSTAVLLKAPEPPSVEPRPAEPSPLVSNILHRPQRTFVEPPKPEPIVAPTKPTTETAPIVQPPALSLNWQGLVLLVWAAVVAALLLLLAQRTFFVRGLVAQAQEASGAMLREMDQCHRHLGLRRPLSLRLSPNAASPAVCGLWRPTILVPQNLAARLHGADLQAVLFHELAHIKRGDLWINLLQTLLQIVYFYNPLLWLANAIIRRLREKAVDETVLVAMGEAAPQYPQTLVNVAQLAFTHRPTLSLRLIGVVESKSALTSRIKHILNRPLPKTAKLGALGLAAVALVAAVLLPMAKGKDNILSGNAGGQIVVARWMVVFQNGAAERVLSEAQPVASQSKVYQGVQLESEELLARVKDCRKGNQVLYLVEDLKWLEPSPKYLRADSWSYTTNLQHPVYSQCSTGGAGPYKLDARPTKAQLDLRYESVHCDLNPGVRVEGSIVFKGSLPPGQALVFAAPLQKDGQTVATHLVVWQAVRVPKDSVKRVPSIRSSTEWIEDVPSLLIAQARMPLPELAAHEYYQMGEPIRVYVHGKISPWKDDTGDVLRKGGMPPAFLRIDGKEYGCLFVFGPFQSAGRTLDIPEELQMSPANFHLPLGRHTAVYGWRDVDVIDPNDPGQPVHFTQLVTNSVQFEIVEQLPPDYYRPVYQEGWEDILHRSIQAPFTDDWSKHGGAGSLLTMEVHSLPFDVAFEIYAQAEGSAQRQPAGQAAVRAGSPPDITTCPLNIEGLNWSTVSDKRWRLILVPSENVAAQNPPIHEFYGREFVTDWVSFERSPQFEQHRREFEPRENKNSSEAQPASVQHAREFGCTLPNGVTVELLGACDYPSEGKQWWRPDGSPLAQAPYDRRGAWVSPDDRNKAPFELALRVRNLPENWDAGIQTPGNSFSDAGDPPYKAGKRLPELRWLMMEAQPNQTTCTLRCDVAAPWQTLARSSVPFTPAPRTPEDGVVFSEIREGFTGGRVMVSGRDSSGEGVSVTVIGRVGGRDEDRSIGVGDLRRIVAVTKDGKMQTAPSDGFYFTGGEGRATAYFPRLSLANVKEFQFQVRPLTWVEFKNVPLRRGLKTDLEVRVQSADVDANAAPSAGTNQEKEIVLPEVDRQRVILDLATGELVPLPPVGPEPEKLQQALRKLGKGDLLYDCDSGDRTLILVRDATSGQAQGDTGEPSWKGYLIGPYLPGVLTIKTAEGRQYRVTILAADDKACTLKYTPIPTDKGAGGGALAEPGKAATLELRIAPRRGELGPDAVQEYTKALAEGRSLAGSRCLWVAVRPGMSLSSDLVTQTHQGQTWLLVYNDNSFIMVPSQGWRLAHVGRNTDEQGRPRLVLRFDDTGANRVNLLTVSHAGQLLAIIVGGTVVSTPLIPEGRDGPRCAALTGDFTEPALEDLATTLRRGIAEPSAGAGFRSVTLRNGVTVELLGICTHPSVRRSWWRPDGSPLPERPYDDDEGRAFPKKGEKGYKLAIRFSGLAGKDVGADVIPSTFKSTNGGTLGQVSQKNDKENVKYLNGVVDEKIVWQGVAFDQELDSFDLRIGVSRGPWQSEYGHEIGKPSDTVEWAIFKDVTLRPMQQTEAAQGAGGGALGALGRYALSFDGVDDCLVVPASASIALKPPYSIEIWVQSDFSTFPRPTNDDRNPGPYMSFIRQGKELPRAAAAQDSPQTDGSARGGGSPMSRGPDDFNGLLAGGFMSFLHGDSGILLSIRPDGRAEQRAGLFPNFLSGDASPWRHYWTYVSSTMGEGFVASEGPLVVGGKLLANGFAFKGMIAQIRLWNKVLTGKEVEERKYFPLTGREPNLVACWTFGEGRGQIVHDISPNHNDAYLGTSKDVDAADPKWVLLSDTSEPKTSRATAAQDISGRVVDPNGRPVARAQVALSTEKIGVVIHDGVLEPWRTSDAEKGPIVETDIQGRFRFEGKPPEDFNVIAAHETGFALTTSDDLRKNREIRLEKWGRIEGQLARGRHALENQIWMSGLPNVTWLKHKREFRYQTHADAAGRFTFDHVPAGWFEVGYLTKTGDIFSSPTSRTPVVVKAGQTTQMKLGGEGRPVVGRFVPPAGYSGPVYFGGGLRSLETARPEPPRPANYNQMAKREQQEWLKKWWQSPQSQAYSDRIWQNPDWRHYAFRIQEDGTFRIEDVIPGQYDLAVWLEERFTGRGRPDEIGAYNGTAEVPAIPGGRTEEPLDLGNLTVSMHNPPLHAGDIAPLFEAKSLDGKEVRLSDYRSTFVLLSFWQPVSNPELDRLKELHRTYGSTGRLQIIGLGGWDTLEEVRRYVAEHKVEWPEIYFGVNTNEGIAAPYGLPGVPYLLLVNPEGKILATELRGEKLTETVRQAMPQTAGSGATDSSPGR